MRKLWRKSASLALAIAMAGTLMSSSAFAQEAEGTAAAEAAGAGLSAAETDDVSTVDAGEAAEAEPDADTSGNADAGTAAENDVSENSAAGAAAEVQTAAKKDASGNISAASDAEGRAVAENEASEETEKPAPEEPEAADGAQMKALSVQTISAGETVEVTIDAEGGYSYLYFTPEEDGVYECHSISDYDTYGYVLDANENVLYYNDDSGDGNNFSIVWECTAGTTYIIKSRFYSTGSTGSFSVTVDASTIDPQDPCSNGYKYYYVQQGDSLTLEASAYNHYGNEADLSGDDYTFEWYKVYNYESESGDWVNQTSDVLGTGSTCTITSVAEDDFYQSAVSQYNYYVCYICKGDETLAMTYCNIYNSDYYYYGWDTGYYRSVGESVTLELNLRDYNGDQADVDDEAFTFEWHKVLNYLDSSTGDWIYEVGDTLGTDASYTINSLSEDDLYLSAALMYNCYMCYVYKNGIQVATVHDYIYYKDYSYSGSGSSYYKTVGESVTLGITL
ncbi:MAG: hypothetical protein LIO75_00180 [Lachnospiraceae bacterium]|nr:hypothetical protein [Lachnospiraceae bacterium]